MSSQLRKTRSMDSSCLELRLGPLPGNSQSSSGHLGPAHHLPAALARARSEANLHASTLSLGPGTYVVRLFHCSFLSSFFSCDKDIDFSRPRSMRPTRNFPPLCSVLIRSAPLHHQPPLYSRNKINLTLD